MGLELNSSRKEVQCITVRITFSVTGTDRQRQYAHTLGRLTVDTDRGMGYVNIAEKTAFLSEKHTDKITADIKKGDCMKKVSKILRDKIKWTVLFGSGSPT
jgi:hypothetical protein